jgi:hypothetical protein
MHAGARKIFKTIFKRSPTQKFVGKYRIHFITQLLYSEKDHSFQKHTTSVQIEELSTSGTFVPWPFGLTSQPSFATIRDTPSLLPSFRFVAV